MATTIELMVLAFMAGAVFGIFWKGSIDKNYEKEVQKVLVDVGQQADDEIANLKKENDRLVKTVNNLQIELAKRGDNEKGNNPR